MAVNAQFTADFAQFDAAVKGATAGLATMEGQSKTLETSLADLALNTGRAIGNLAKDITAAAGSFLSSYAEEEAATRRLISALEVQGLATDQVIADYATMASSFQTTTRYSDDLVTSAQALFSTIGRVGPKDMQAAITAATNLSSALGYDLPTSAMMLSKVIVSEGKTLGKLGPLLEGISLHGMSASEMFAVISERTGPAAANELKTVAGQTAYLNNQMDDAKGKIGGMIASALMPLVQGFMALPEPLQAVIGGTIALGLAIAPIAISIGALAPAVMALASAMGLTLVGALTTLGALLLPGAALIVGVTALYLAFKNWDKITAICYDVYTGIKRWLVDGFTALVSTIMAPIETVIGGFKALYERVVGGSYVPDLINGIASEFAKLDSVMVAPAVQAASKTEAALGQAMTAIGQLAGGTLAGPGGLTLTPLTQGAGGVTSGGLMGQLARLTDFFGASLDPLTAAYRAAGIFTNPSGGAGGLRPPVTINVNGSVLGNKEEIARVVGDALTSSYRTGGNRLPV
jgi:hypothetical protein